MCFNKQLLYMVELVGLNGAILQNMALAPSGT